MWISFCWYWFSPKTLKHSEQIADFHDRLQRFPFLEAVLCLVGIFVF
jgi:hypothetical protein